MGYNLKSTSFRFVWITCLWDISLKDACMSIYLMPGDINLQNHIILIKKDKVISEVLPSNQITRLICDF